MEKRRLSNGLTEEDLHDSANRECRIDEREAELHRGVREEIVEADSEMR